MKPSRAIKVKSKGYFHETMAYLDKRLKKYDSSHENFVVPWQMGEKQRKEYNF